MFTIASRVRSYRFRGIFLLAVLVVGLVLCTVHANDAASKAFDGYWTYNNECNFGHYAAIKLVQKNRDVTGDWSDGTRSEGWDGSLRGTIRDDKLYAKYCSTEANAGHRLCPNYDASESDYFVRQGRDLAWYRSVGQGAERTLQKYLVLHPSTKGMPGPVDTDCPDNDN